MRAHDSTPDDTAAQVSTGDLPDLETVQELVALAHRTYLDVRDGHVADYIPALAEASPDLFGIAIVGVRGRAGGIGDSTHPFTIQSVVKPFLFALVCEALGHREVREKLGVNATGLPFDSVMAVEIAADGLTNPLVNSGAIAATSLAPGETAEQKWEFLREGLSRFAGRDLEVDQVVLDSERATNGRNEAMARLMAGHGRLYFDPDEATDVYTRLCSLKVTAMDLATMGATLADGGVNPVTLRRVVSPDTCRRTLAVMLTAGLYELSGRLALRDRAAGQERGERGDRHGRTRQGRARHVLATRWTRPGTACADSWPPSCSPRHSGSTCWSRGRSRSRQPPRPEPRPEPQSSAFCCRFWTTTMKMPSATQIRNDVVWVAGLFGVAEEAQGRRRDQSQPAEGERRTGGRGGPAHEPVAHLLGQEGAGQRHGGDEDEREHQARVALVHDEEQLGARRRRR